MPKPLDIMDEVDGMYEAQEAARQRLCANITNEEIDEQAVLDDWEDTDWYEED